MKIITGIKKMKRYARGMQARGRSIGFVPTMGYLHKGHVSLLERARKENDIVVLSIYVNPIQFGPKEDFTKYPRDMRRDSKMAKGAGTDVIFAPVDKEMYPDDYAAYVDVKRLTDNLCGLARPGHFSGVATVVTKLFEIIRPDTAYFGQKDIQQSVIIKRMTEDLNIDVEVKVMPTVREKDGLAMSSRNTYLSADERRDAIVLNKALRAAKKMFLSGERRSSNVIRKIRELITAKNSAKIDYIKVVDPTSLKDINTLTKGAIIALAVFIGKTRLIDNIILGG